MSVSPTEEKKKTKNNVFFREKKVVILLMLNCEVMKIIGNSSSSWDVTHSTSMDVCVTELQHACEILHRTGGTS